ncbi:MAG: hypothetical protein HYU86_04910 [Chloroflexi bacterium]|nr:hypothetical protein [Chloroflexota bacterium]
MKGFFQALRAGCLSLMLAVTFLIVVALAVGAATVWYISRSPRLEATMTIPVTEGGKEKEVQVRLFTEREPEIPPEALLKAGQIKVDIQLFGPGDFKFFSSRVNVAFPITDIIAAFVGEASGFGDLEKRAHQEPAVVAKEIFGPDADKNLRQLLSSRSSQEWEKMLGKNYQEALQGIFGDHPEKTLQQVFQDNPQRVLDVLKTYLVSGALEGQIRP